LCQTEKSFQAGEIGNLVQLENSFNIFQGIVWSKFNLLRSMLKDGAKFVIN